MSPPRTTPREAPHNLPLQLTSFHGRDREVVEVERLLVGASGTLGGGPRLLTLTGAGGCGKTRLALHVAARVNRAGGAPDADGVWLVELAALSEPALVAQTVAAALGVREAPGTSVTDRLVAYLRHKSLLLLLDNCEHVVGAVADLVETLLRSCPGLRVLATSREGLGVAGETTWPVPSLTVPSPAAPGQADLSLEQLARYEGVRLFVDRARAARPGFVVTDENAPALAEICRRLDGIPLALELAAARVNVFSLEQIAARLDDRFPLLSAGQRTALPRQQTLRATVDWSYALLSEPERALLRRLAVFAGGWSFEAAEAVAAGDGVRAHAVLDLLAGLVGKSLVVAEEQRGAVRYRLLETIRHYARDRLSEAAETEGTRDRHLDRFLALAEQAEPKLRGEEWRAVLDRLKAEHDNLRAALEWALTSGAGEAALRLAGALAWFWWLRSYHDEGRRWLERALAAAPQRTAARTRALLGAGWLAQHRRDLAGARELLGESLAVGREVDDRWAVALALHHLGRVAYYEDDPATARALGQESLAVAEGLGDDWLIAWALHLLGLAACIAADFPTAEAYYARSLAIRRELGYQEGIAILLNLVGIVALREGDLARAHALQRESLAEVQDVLGPWGAAMPLANFSYIAAARGQPARAARLGGAALALGESFHTPLVPLSEAVLREGLELARQALGEAAYAAALEEGRALPLDGAIAEALSLEVVPPAQPSARPPGPGEHGPFDTLTPAEVKVLRLLAGGLTTKEIATELVVAVSTVDRHITHIYDKLGVRNRTGATAFALEHGLR